MTKFENLCEKLNMVWIDEDDHGTTYAKKEIEATLLTNGEFEVYNGNTDAMVNFTDIEKLEKYIVNNI